jgi:hypothetical protein
MADSSDSSGQSRRFRPTRIGRAFVFAGGLFAVAAMGVAQGTAFAADAPVAISNLKSGVVCGLPQNRRVCFQTTEIFVTNESTCNYVGKEKNCTWFGFSFDYKLPDGQKTVELDCTVQTDTPTDFGNPNAMVAKNATGMTIKLELSRDQSHFFNQQYAISPEDGNSRAIEHSKQSCSYAGQTVFELEFNVHYPDP